MDCFHVVYNRAVLTIPQHLCWGTTVIVCICNGLNDRDIKEICDSCETKEEFTECINNKMKERSCRSCYCQLVDSFRNEAEE